MAPTNGEGSATFRSPNPQEASAVAGESSSTSSPQLSKPPTYNGDLANLAPGLAAAVVHLPNFVVWKWVWKWDKKRRKGKWTKPPYQARHPDRKASTTNPKTWAPYDVALAAVQRCEADGLGVVITKGHADHIIGGDLDKCRDLTNGAVKPWAQSFLDKAAMLGAYVEQSVSGTGFRIVGLGDGAAITEEKERYEVPGASSEEEHVELYHKSNGRYLTISGNQIGTCSNPLPNIAAFADEIIRTLSGAAGVNLKDAAKKPKDKSPSGKFASVVWSMFNQGDTDDLVEAKLRENLKRDPDGVGARYEREERLRGEIERCRKDWIEARGVTLEDFYAYMPNHDFVFMPTREHWPASSVDDRIPPVVLVDRDGNPVTDRQGRPKKIKASRWLSQNKPVEQKTWAPGEPEVIRDRLVDESGWFDRPGVACLNLYRPPTIILRDKHKAQPYVDLWHKLYPEDADHCLNYYAHRVQKPHEKINHAIIQGGRYRIGKDSLVEPLRHAVGPWNFKDISPHAIFGTFNSFMKSTVVLRISEARDQGNQVKFDRFQFFERMKTILATPPDTVEVNEKHVGQYYVRNIAGVIITANRKDSFYLPTGACRHYVAWSTLEREHATPEFWIDFYRWYEDGGYGHVASYLAERDISKFNPKAPPKETDAYWEIVGLNTAPEDVQLTDVLEALGKRENPDGTVIVVLPDAVTMLQIRHKALEIGDRDFYHHLGDRSHARAIPHRMERCGYVSIHNPSAPSDGRWQVGAKKHTVYVRSKLTIRERHKAVAALIELAKDDIAELEARRQTSSIWA